MGIKIFIWIKFQLKWRSFFILKHYFRIDKAVPSVDNKQLVGGKHLSFNCDSFTNKEERTTHLKFSVHFPLTLPNTMMDQLAIKMKNLARLPTKYHFSCSPPIYISPPDFAPSTNSILGTFVLICPPDWIWAVNQCNLVCARFYLVCVCAHLKLVQRGRDWTECVCLCIFIEWNSE